MPRVSDAREKLMDAAKELIWANSYGATSVDDICTRAKVKKGSFYYFFRSKADLEIAALDADWCMSRQRLDHLFSPSVPPLERLAACFDFAEQKQAALQAECGKVLGCPLFVLGTEITTQESGIREKVSSILNRYEQYFETAIRDAHAAGALHAPDAKLKARILFAWFQGTLTQARIENRIELLHGLKEQAFALLGAEVPPVHVEKAEPALAEAGAAIA